MDWSLVQSFLAVAETGSLSAAARRLSLSQPTLGRHIQTFEKALKLSLFERHPRGLRLSEAGERILPLAQQAQHTMSAMALAAEGESQTLAGTVRITASVFASHYILPEIIAKIRAVEPLIELELVPSDITENLLFRAADIAVRMYRPRQIDIVARHVRDIGMCVCAASSYLDRAGRPATAEDLLSHDLVGFDENPLIIETMQSMGWSATRHSFAVRCDNQSAYWQLIRTGCGIGFSQRSIAESDPLVEVLPLDLPIPPLPVWLAAPQAMRQTPRIRRVWDLLAEGLLSAPF
ncbi:transcriptional regulator, LysR family [Ruegeria marina]|uniref:Transcriptional regulator, LysR family n=2 Tax=Ruegeria marina TaxID=639004 RepID=A0A1G6P4J2_9RHOB|nr:transcriptional regulator, LysR family [Ruegeria marina]